MLALVSVTKSAFLDVDNERFKSVVSLSNEKSTQQRKDNCNNEENVSSSTLQLLRIKGSPRLLPEGILTLVNYCHCLRELSLSYSLLSDELLTSLSSDQKVNLETLRIEVHSEMRPLPRVSDKSWSVFASRFPNINLVLLSYVTEEDERNPLFTTHVPITHLYFGETPPESMISRIGQHCPHLVELVIAVYGSTLVDRILIDAARGCSRLSAVGLGDCEISCTSLVEFVTLCADRLQILYIRETSLIEDMEFDITTMTAKISFLLGRTWVPEYIPLW